MAEARRRVEALEAELATAKELIEAQGKVSALLRETVPPERRADYDEAITAMIEVWTPRVGVEAACRAFGVSPRTWRHRR